MKTEVIPEVGDKFAIKNRRFGFSFTNKAGGTGMSNWEFDVKYTGTAPIVKITKVWFDEECGYRCWSEAVSPELIAYLKEVASPSDQRVFVSQWDLEVIK